ncbi:hypothetical protein [Gryllotalpicola ginsengisoli]|uniref:hypothetical protein n=1 Tax=Gryllotalpicola ginsengisoli TaxID=444608 RepID=UPI0003B4A75B|nr:hypothetical protein [Gryllotalpicola ginsengisoli]
MTDADRPRRSSRWVLLGVGLVLVLVAAALVAWQHVRTEASPAQVATEYWQDLADGKAQEALALTDLPAQNNALLLTDKVYAMADRRIADVTGKGAMQDGDTATATVSVKLNGEPTTVRMSLEREQHGFFSPQTWHLTDVKLATLQVTVSGSGHADALSVDGVTLPLPQGDGTLSIPALPGVYSIALHSSSALFTAAPQKVAAFDTAATQKVSLTLAPSAQLKQQAVSAASKLLSGCFTQPTLASGCTLTQGIRNLFNLTAEDSVTYQLTVAPKLAFRQSGSTMEVVSTSPGTIVATPTDALWGTFTNTAQFSAAFDVAVDGDKVTVSPRQGGLTLVDYTD